MNHWRHPDIHCRPRRMVHPDWLGRCIPADGSQWGLKGTGDYHTGGCTNTRDYPLESSEHPAFFKRLWMACSQGYKVVQRTTSSWLVQHWRSTIRMCFSRGSQSVDFLSVWRSVRSRRKISNFWGIWLARMDWSTRPRKNLRDCQNAAAQGQEEVKILLGHDKLLFFWSRDAIHERTFGRPGEKR